MDGYYDNDAVSVVRDGLEDGRLDESGQTAAAILAERLTRVQRLGGLFEQIRFSPQVDALMSRQMAGAV